MEKSSTVKYSFLMKLGENLIVIVDELIESQSQSGKVRLKPDKERDCIRVIVDGLGEIGTITREDTEELLSGIEPQPVEPSGSADLSISTRGVKVMIPVEGQLYVAIVRQVRNMLDKWPRRKATVFKV